jgi:hypothetical protein
MTLLGVVLLWLQARSGWTGTRDETGPATLAFTAVMLSFPVVGVLIVRRQPRNVVGWLLLGVGLVTGLSGIADSYARLGLVVAPGSVPGPAVAEAFNEASWAPLIGLMGTFLILLYPDGHLPSPRWRGLAWLSAVSIVCVTATITLLPGSLSEGPVPGLRNPLGIQAAAPVLNALLTVFLPLLPLCIVGCAVALVGRFRRSQGEERLQLKWLASAGAVVAFLYLCTMATSGLSAWLGVPDQESIPLLVLQNVAILSFVLLPVAIGIAILRHGLYGIDVVINRTIVYGSLTAALLGLYVASVLLLQRLLSPLTDTSDLAVAGSTLAVAAVFRPTRARIQRAVDRRFYRNRYDAARTVEAFASRLGHEVDLDAVGRDLSACVDEAVRPAHLSLWIREADS